MRSALALACLFASSALAEVNVLTHHNDNTRNGLNTNETVLTVARVNTASFGKIFAYQVDGYVYAQPLYVSNLNIPGLGARNVVFVATQHNSVYALDADSRSGPNNGLLWQVNLGPSAATPTLDFGNRFGAFTTIVPEVGITGTPVIDLASGNLYVDTFTHEGSNYIHKLHALSITNGAERSFSPATVAAAVPGIGVGSSNGAVRFEARQQIQRAALTLVNGIVYVAYAGYDDTDPYHGWIIGYNAANLQQLTNYVFNTTPNSSIAAFGPHAGEGGIWMAGAGLSADVANSLYFGVGNGSFNATNAAGKEFGDSFIRLSTSGQLAVADYFTPYNQAFLADNDIDVGSGGLLLLPDQPGPFPRLMLGGGKQGTVYLINRDMMTVGNEHYNRTSAVDHVVQTLALGGPVFHTPAYFNSSVYFIASGDVPAAFSVVNGRLSTFPTSTASRTFAYPGATPTVSANGNRDGIVWALRMGTPGLLTAYNATNLASEIYTSDQAAGGRDTLTNGVKFSLPTVANGKVYVGGQYALSVFGILAGGIQFSSSVYFARETAGNATITVNRTGASRGLVRVNWATVPGGTAVAGVNYTSSSGILTWNDGDAAPKTFTVPVLDDHLASGSKTVNLLLTNATGGAYLDARSNAVLTIIEGPSESWKFSHFAANANNQTIAGDLADPDADKIINLLEYAHATDPNQADSNTRPIGLVTNNHFQVLFHQNLSATDLVYRVQMTGVLGGSWSNLVTSTAAGSWVTNTPGASVVKSNPLGSPPDQYSVVAVTDPALVRQTIGNRFYRVAVQRP